MGGADLLSPVPGKIKPAVKGLQGAVLRSCPQPCPQAGFHLLLAHCSLYWRANTFTKHLGGFLVALERILIDSSKIVE
jgi:hypothetical protein